MKILVLTISDRASAGIYEDLSGPAAREVLKKELPDAEITVTIVADDAPAILSIFKEHADTDIILTVGGTGIGPRDITPETTSNYCERLLPGIAEFLRAESLKQTRNAMLSRGVAGIQGRTAIINLPGSPKAASYCAALLAPVLEHIGRMLRSDPH